MDSTILAALITLVGTVLAAMIQFIPARVERRIRGLRNGRMTKSRALEEIDRLYQERQARGLPLRRRVDQLVEEERR